MQNTIGTSRNTARSVFLLICLLGIAILPPVFPVNSQNKDHLLQTPSEPVGHFSTSLISYLLAVAPDGTYFSSQTDLYISRDQGASWDVKSFWVDPSTSSLGFTIEFLAISPDYVNDGTAFAATKYINNYPLWETRDFGNTWTPTNWGGSGTIKHVQFSPNYAIDHTIYASTPLKKSIDEGRTWVPVDKPASVGEVNIAISTNYALDHLVVISFYTQVGGSLVTNVLKSNDDSQWVPAGSGILVDNSSTLLDLFFVPDWFTEDGDPILLASTTEGIKVSYNTGDSWEILCSRPVQNLAAVKHPASSNLEFFALDYFNSSLLIHSTDSGNTWTNVSIYQDAYVYQFILSSNYKTDGEIYANTKTGVWKSADGGVIWQQIIPLIGTRGNVEQQVLLSPDYENDRTVFAYGMTKLPTPILKSTDGGRTWESIPLPFYPNQDVYWRMALSQKYAYDHTVFISYGKDVYQSTDGGDHWDKMGTSAPGNIIVLKAASEDLSNIDLFIITDNYELARCNAHCASWEILKPRQYVAIDVLISPNYSNDHTIFYNQQKVSMSTDSGENWVDVPTPGGGILAISPDFASDHAFFWGNTTTSAGGLYKSTDDGLHWDKLPGPFDYFMGYIEVSPHYSQDQTLVAGTSSGIPYLSEDGGNHWTRLPTSRSLDSLAIGYEDGLFTVFVGLDYNLVYRYDWPDLIPIKPISAIAPSGSTDPVNFSLELQNTYSAPATWETTQPSGWVNLSKTSGTYPDQLDLSLDPSNLSGLNKTQLTIQVYYSLHQTKNVIIPISILLYTNQNWIPIVSR
jgi:photosystem II stability/assembly factor-like uncharacterized protein